MSTFNDILAAVGSQLQTLALVPPGQVVIRKVPKFEEGIDPGPPLLCVTPAGDEVITYAFGGRLISYPVLVVLIGANDGDQSQGLGTRLDWRQQARQAFNCTLAGVASVWDTDLDFQPAFDRSGIAAQYDVSPLLLTFHTSEVS